MMRIVKAKRWTSTVGQKREICLFKAGNPDVTLKQISDIFSAQWSVTIAPSTVGDILRTSEKWLAAPEHALKYLHYAGESQKQSTDIIEENRVQPIQDVESASEIDNNHNNETVTASDARLGILNTITFLQGNLNSFTENYIEALRCILQYIETQLPGNHVADGESTSLGEVAEETSAGEQINVVVTDESEHTVRGEDYYVLCEGQTTSCDAEEQGSETILLLNIGDALTEEPSDTQNTHQNTHHSDTSNEHEGVQDTPEPIVTTDDSSVPENVTACMDCDPAIDGGMLSGETETFEIEQVASTVHNHDHMYQNSSQRPCSGTDCKSGSNGELNLDHQIIPCLDRKANDLENDVDNEISIKTELPIVSIETEVSDGPQESSMEASHFGDQNDTNIEDESVQHGKLSTKPLYPHKCSICGKYLKTNDELREHESSHAERKHKCGTCGKKFVRPFSLKLHQRIHSGEKPHYCETCGKSFATRNSYRQHVKIHLGIKDYKCTVCEQAFTQSGSLKAHLATHTEEKPFACRLCEKRFTQSGNLIAHMAMHRGEKDWICSVCAKAFTTKGSLVRHEETHVSKPSKPPRKSGETVKSISCSQCEKTFSSAKYYKSHIRYMHPPSAESRLNECSICFKVFAAAYCLKKHMMIHNGEKPFSCEICGKSFNQNNNLKIHQRTHTGAKPHTCNICGKNFSQSCNLTAHKKKTHSDMRPFTCSLCAKGFKDKATLLRHELIHSRELR